MSACFGQMLLTTASLRYPSVTPRRFSSRSTSARPQSESSSSTRWFWLYAAGTRLAKRRCERKWHKGPAVAPESLR
ncbi:hypothetical protein BJY59DRAFT_704981 [Rhodotorula toruloides]